MSEESNPVIEYADSYRDAARKGQKLVDLGSLVTDLERDIAPLFDAAQSELAALREELATAQLSLSIEQAKLGQVRACLAASEQRNAACKEEIVTMVESALRRSFSLGQIYWQQADSDSTCQQNKSDQTMEVQTQHVLNVVKSINALTKPSESGASE